MCINSYRQGPHATSTARISKTRQEYGGRHKLASSTLICSFTGDTRYIPDHLHRSNRQAACMDTVHAAQNTYCTPRTLNCTVGLFTTFRASYVLTRVCDSPPLLHCTAKGIFATIYRTNCIIYSSLKVNRCLWPGIRGMC